MTPTLPAPTDVVFFSAAALALGAWLACAAPAAEAAPDRQAFVALSASVLKIEVQRAQGGFSLGSGVVVDADKVVTNCHVTRDGTEIHVLRGDVRWRVESEAADVDHDLCVLQVPRLKADTVRLGNTWGLAIGQSVTALGFTGGLGIQSSPGDVVALHKYDGARVIQSTNWFSSGASGGGLFDDDLRLVGILTFRLRGGEAHYFAAPVEWIKRVLADPDAFKPVAPIDPQLVPYWLRPPTQQPNFLQAGALEREHRWDELDALASKWKRADVADPQAWYAEGVAREGLGHYDDAQRSFERAVSLEPASRIGWYRLGMVSLRKGELARALQARGKLDDLHSDLADQLGQAIAAH